MKVIYIFIAIILLNQLAIQRKLNMNNDKLDNLECITIDNIKPEKRKRRIDSYDFSNL